MPCALVVDDQDDVRMLLRHILQGAGFTVVEAGGGPEALALLDSGERPDVVLLDVQMPDMDGWTTLTEIRRAPGCHPPVLLCTVKSGLADIVRGYELGCDGYLAKPFHPPELTEQVRSVLLRSEAERAAARAGELRQARRLAALIR